MARVLSVRARYVGCPFIFKGTNAFNGGIHFFHLTHASNLLRVEPTKCAIVLVPVRAFDVKLYGISVQLVIIMDTVSVNKFRDNLKTLVEQVVSEHEPLKVTRRSGDDFVVLSAEDWEREQESLRILQNSDLMRQISASLATHSQNTGYKPTVEQMNEITGI